MRSPHGPYSREYEPEGSKGYFFGDDVRFRIRGGEVSPLFPEAHQRLRDGDPLDDPQLPLVWAANG